MAVDVRARSGCALRPPSVGFSADGEKTKYVWEEAFARSKLLATPPWLCDAINRSCPACSPTPKRLRTRPAGPAGMHPMSAKGKQWRESQAVIDDMRSLLEACGDRTSTYHHSEQMRTVVSHCFRNSGLRECVYGEKHVNNNFALLENALAVKYKCFSKECVAEEAIPIGRLHARALVPHARDMRRWQTAVVLELLQSLDVQGDVSGGPREDSPLHDALKYCNTYFVLVREPAPVVVEIVYRDASCKLVEDVFIRTLMEMKLLTENVRVVNPMTGKHVGMDIIWRQSAHRREVVRMDFLPDHIEAFVETPRGLYLNTSPGFLISFDPNFVVSEDVLELLLFHLRRCWARGQAVCVSLMVRVG